MALAVLIRRWRALAVLMLAPLLVACENSATSYSIAGSQHAMILVREQPYFWDDEVRQFVVVARLPHCQKQQRLDQAKRLNRACLCLMMP